MFSTSRTLSSAFLVIFMLAACGGSAPTPGKAETPATPEAARAFVASVETALRRLWVAQSEAEWKKNTNITDATEAAAAKANEAVMEYLAHAIKTARRFAGLALDADTARQLTLLRIAGGLPAPDDPKKREELAAIAARMEAIYGKGKACDAGACRDLGQLEDVLASSRNYEEELSAWSGWHRVGRELRSLYARYVELANEGAQEIGFADLGEMWRSGYDMSPVELEAEVERLWQEVRPLYEQLHCYVRARLVEKYGNRIPATGAIPAHLLGNMWAQEWDSIYPLVEPYPGEASLDVTKALTAQKYDALRMVRLGEAFFTSLGLDPLPETFWQRSLFVKPDDREVVCHASAWDVTYADDLRIKMCTKITQDDLVTIHHELGHNYYFHYYYTLPMLYQAGAQDGFHEAIGDAVVLSATPGYWKRVGLLDAVPSGERGLVNQQLKDALHRVAFLPFAVMMDKWRWGVFAGKIAPEEYNTAWWELRRRYQGVDAPVPRAAEDFDPGAKYHIAANVSYLRYFLAAVLQFQLHRAMCRAAGHTGPLSECSVYGSKEAGAKLKSLLALGASRPWPEALEVATGERQMDASALREYFAPLAAWLEKENRGKQCGW